MTTSKRLYTASQLTLTDRYLNFGSHHTKSTKIGIMKCMKKRAEAICSTDSAYNKELSHLHNVFSENGFPSGLVRSVLYSNRNRTRPTEGQLPFRWCIPFVEGVSEKLSRIAKSFGVKTFFSACPTVSSNLVKMKDPVPNESKAGIVYCMKCSCGKCYIGQTGRQLNSRLNEHKIAIRKKDDKNAMAVHLKNADPLHQVTLEETTVLHQEKHWRKREIKEGLYIKMHANSLVNGNEGSEISDIWDQFNDDLCSSHRLY